MTVSIKPIPPEAMAVRDIKDCRCCDNPKPACFIKEGLLFGSEVIKCESCLQKLKIVTETFFTPK
jgi:hypothetical protein